MKKIRIIGNYITNFGELWDRSLESLFEEAVFGVLNSVEGDKFENRKIKHEFSTILAESKFNQGEIEAVFVANMAGGQFANQQHLSALVSQMLPHQPPAFRVEAACASGSMALEMAQLALLSGKYKTVLVVGAEKMTDVMSGDATKILSGASEYQKEYGSTFPALYALLAKVHMQKFGTSREQLSIVANQNHKHALDNPKAQFQKEIPVEVISNSTVISDPLRLFDCSPVSDGASAVILTTKNIKKYAEKPVIVGIGHAQDTLSLADRSSLTELKATKLAARQAYLQAGIGPENISFAEVHDCFTIAEILAIEDLGFFNKGEGGKAIEQGKTTFEQGKTTFEQDKTTFGGSVVINPSGGLKACGHPVGATGVKQVAFLAQLLQTNSIYQNVVHQSEKVDVKSSGINAKLNPDTNKSNSKKIYALAHNVGGSGATVIVHILCQDLVKKIKYVKNKINKRVKNKINIKN
jgi:acetyl-CoA C-acetyltransferase